MLQSSFSVGSNNSEKFRRGVGCPLQRTPLPQNLLAGCIFDSSAVKSAFALLLTRVTEPRTVKFIRLEV